MLQIAAMATTLYSSSEESVLSQDNDTRSLKANILRVPYHCNSVSLIDHLLVELRNDQNHLSTSFEASQESNDCPANNTNTRPESERHLYNVYKPSCSHSGPAITSRSSSRPIAERLFSTPRRRSKLRELILARDRWIPPRSSSSSAVTNYHVRKLPLELTGNERILRQRERSEDPFRRRRQRTPAIPRCTHNFSQPPHISPHIVDHEVVLSRFPWSGQRINARQVSIGAVWNVGGASIATRGPWLGIIDGQKGYSGSNTTAPLYFARYESIGDISISDELEMNQTRLAAAFGLDLVCRQLVISRPSPPADNHVCPSSPHFEKTRPLVWKDCEWKRADYVPDAPASSGQSKRSFAPVPYCIVWSHLIKDDFYRSVLAHCPHSGFLAYAMPQTIVLWSTSTCRHEAAFTLDYPDQDQVAALAFSSADGKQSILAAGTCCGYLHLWETLKPRKRFTWHFNDPVTSVAFKSTVTRCLSTFFPSTRVFVEHLVVGDKQGIIWYYSVEISHFEALSRVTLLARIDAHYGCICSITWSPDNKYLATSGDDNVCLLFDLNRILHDQETTSIAAMKPSKTDQYRLRSGIPQARSSTIVSQLARILGDRSNMDAAYTLSRPQRPTDAPSHTSSTSGGTSPVHILPGNSETDGLYRHVRDSAASMLGSPGCGTTPRVLPPRHIASIDHSPVLEYLKSATYIPRGHHVHQFEHRSAIKAVAFAPWQPTLLATGGGMGDRTVHFYHTPSGSCLAKIYMWAQVTSLIWSKSRREIAVILGFPEFTHPYRVVVFAWPSCEQITAIPWNINLDGQAFPNYYVAGRALSATRVPNFRNSLYEVGDESNFDPEDECIAISANDYIRFYRIWGKPHKQFTGSVGIMHSAILETIDGIENPGKEIIR